MRWRGTSRLPVFLRHTKSAPESESEPLSKQSRRLPLLSSRFVVQRKRQTKREARLSHIRYEARAQGKKLFLSRSFFVCSLFFMALTRDRFLSKHVEEDARAHTDAVHDTHSATSAFFLQAVDSHPSPLQASLVLARAAIAKPLPVCVTAQVANDLSFKAFVISEVELFNFRKIARFVSAFSSCHAQAVAE